MGLCAQGSDFLAMITKYRYYPALAGKNQVLFFYLRTFVFDVVGLLS